MGVRKRNVCLMKPWIVLTGIALVLEIFAILWTILNLNLRMAIGGIFPGLVHAYFFLVVWSYKAEVKEGRLLQKVDQVNQTIQFHFNQHNWLNPPLPARPGHPALLQPAQLCQQRG